MEQCPGCGNVIPEELLVWWNETDRLIEPGLLEQDGIRLEREMTACIDGQLVRFEWEDEDWVDGSVAVTRMIEVGGSRRLVILHE